MLKDNSMRINDLFHQRRITLETQAQKLETKLADILRSYSKIEDPNPNPNPTQLETKLVDIRTQLKAVDDIRTQLKAVDDIRTQLKAVDAAVKAVDAAETDYRAVLAIIIKTQPFGRKLPDDLKLSIVGGVGGWHSYMVARVSSGFRASVKKARELRMYGAQGLSISAGHSHTVISIWGRVYTCGGYQANEDEDNADFYRAHLGHGDSVIELVPRFVEALVGVNVVGTAAGGDHTVVWTDEGKAYSFGYGMFGRLGHGGEENERVPRLIAGVLMGKRVIGVSSGGIHTVVMTAEGKAYSFGWGMFGRLGHGSEETELVPRLIAGVLVGKRVVGVAAGGAHTVVWTDEGKAYSFGNGRDGRLGHGGEEDEYVPRLIEGVLVGKRVVGVSAGSYHTVVWTDEGKAYSFGWGMFGRLGHGSEETELVPRLIEGALVGIYDTGKRVIGVSAGTTHTVVWTDEGKAYSFGYGVHGRLGHGGEENEYVPRVIEGALVGIYDTGKRVIGVSAGTTHTVVWTDEEKAYSFGNGRDGRLGHGGQKNELMPRLVTPPLPLI